MIDKHGWEGGMVKQRELDFSAQKSKNLGVNTNRRAFRA